jgi:hypothetical protein
MPSIFKYKATGTNGHEFIEIEDQEGNRYRIQFDRLEGGLQINKTNDTGASEAIAIYPNCANQIRVK